MNNITLVYEVVSGLKRFDAVNMNILFVLLVFSSLGVLLASNGANKVEDCVDCDRGMEFPKIQNLVRRKKVGGSLRIAPAQRGSLNEETERHIRANAVSRAFAFEAC